MKFWGWFFRILFVALGITVFMFQSHHVKKSILEHILNQSVKNSSLRVEVEGVRGIFPFQFEVTSLLLKNKEKVLAELKDITAFWSIPDLLAQVIKVNVRMKQDLGGDVIYRIDKHALFIDLQGDGLALWKQCALQSIQIKLPELTLVRGDINAKLMNDHIPLTIKMNLEELDEERLKIKDIIIHGKDLQGNGYGIIYPKKGTWEGDMAVSLHEISTYNFLLPEPMKGSANLRGQKERDGPLKLDAELGSFQYRNTTIKSVDINALMIENSLQKLVCRGKEVSFNNIPFENVSASGSFSDGRGTFRIEGKGPKNISLYSQGTIDLLKTENSREITFERAELIHPVHRFFLRRPAKLEWGDHFIQTQEVWFGVGTGKVSIRDLMIHDDVMSGHIDVDRFPLTVLRVLNTDWIASGYLIGKAELGGTLKNPNVELTLDGKALQWGLPDALQIKKSANSIQLDMGSGFKLSKGYLTWRVDILSGQLFKLKSQGKLSTDQWYPTSKSSIDGSLNGHGDMRIISHFIQNGDVIQGSAAVDLSVKGTIQKPVINGNILVTKGLYENSEFGTLIRNITIRGKASNNLINFSSISGQDNSKGRVNGQCLVKLNSLLNPELDLQLNLEKLIVAQTDDVSCKANGSLILQGPLFGEEMNKTKITGEVIVQPLQIHLEDHLEKLVSIQLLEKKSDGSYETIKERSQQITAQEGPSKISLDIKLKAPGEVYIHGYGLDTQWKGDMRILGTLMDPYLTGEITLMRGKFDMMGKPFKLTEGRITYVQSHKNDPHLMIVGTREVGEITAIMHIDGYSSDPKISFSSNPMLTQEEVLARVLFGRGIDSMSVTQSLLLANALSTFKGKNNLNFIDKFRTAFGLDTIEFKERTSPTEDEFQSPSQMVSVGKQITDRIYLSIDQSVSGESGTSATVQYDVSSSLKVEADVGGDTNTGVGFAWVKKY